MYKYYNANALNKYEDDCVIRAISCATDKSWDYVYDYLSDYGKEVMKELNKQADSYTYDDSDAMTDYFNHGTYMWVNIGKYDKPYQVKESKSTKSSGNQITNSLQQKAYEKYKREHPNSKLTFEQFKKEQD